MMPIVQPGMVLQGRYRVVRELGKGGFAQTFEVDDGDQIKVLKVLLPIMQSTFPKAVALFQQEAKVLSQLNHPGIPKVQPDGYFTWSVDGQEPLQCLVMEKIEGLNLEKWLSSRNNQPITQEQAIAWLKQLVAILQQLHEQWYFHRDIKPPNIILKPNGQLVLIDFGAVREVTETYLLKQAGNVAGTRIGSPGYLPLEQVEGHALPQSDFFALGRTFVHLLTGRHPVHLRSPQTQEWSWRSYAPHVSEPLADLLEELMAPLPKNRPQTAREIEQRLAEIELARAANAPIVSDDLATALPPQPEDIDRHKIPIIPLAWVGSIAVNFGWAVLLLLRMVGFRSLSPKLEVVFNDKGVENHLANRLAIAKIYYQCALLLAPDYKKVHYNLGSLYEKQGKFREARANYKIAMQGGMTAASNNLGRMYILEKDYAAAVELLQKGLELKPDDEVRYALLKNLGWALLKQERYGEARRYLREAIYLRSDRAVPYALLAQVLEAEGDRQNARLAWDNFFKYADNDPSPEVDAWKMIAP
ncbi:MAG TPA: serine/threonine protein kinase [Cyanobacteria bacterium UBA8803]|nr:serine/threonine protein kinase [Cyanobacteria bacterium UBA8803]